MKLDDGKVCMHAYAVLILMAGILNSNSNSVFMHLIIGKVYLKFCLRAEMDALKDGGVLSRALKFCSLRLPCDMCAERTPNS